MAQVLADRRDLDFVIWEQMKGEQYLRTERYRSFDRKMCDMVITEARTLAIKELLPTLVEGDRMGVLFENGAVKVPEGFHRAYRLVVEGGWNNLGVPEEMGGQGAPPMVFAAATEYLMAANWSLFAYAGTGVGAAALIHKFGTQEQKDTYAKRMISGQWGGTILITEPDAGSDVGALMTSATEREDGTYSIVGNKIFITCGEHDLVGNIIHPVLARIEGDPHGTKGISMFIVPKFLVGPEGTLGERNAIVCEGVEEKHGIHASATCRMALGANGKCTGFLLGDERQGMKTVSYILKYSRLATGLQGLALASAAYLLAVNYARQRVQGRQVGKQMDEGARSVPIIEHPDVRRNLIWMKAHLNGMRSFYYYVVRCETEGMLQNPGRERQLHLGMVDLLTPLVKDYIATKGYEICVQAIQIFGGAGYTKDYLVEQYARNCRITSIFEGTSGIQAIDLLAHKLGMQKGTVFAHLLGEIHKGAGQADEFDDLKGISKKVRIAATRLSDVAAHLSKTAQSPNPGVAFAHFLPFLYAMGDTIMAWMLLWRAAQATQKIRIADAKDVPSYEGQIKTAQFFIGTVLPATLGRMDAIEAGSPAALEMNSASF